MMLILYIRLLVMHIRAQLEYEADFWIGIGGIFLQQLAGFTFVWVVFSRVPQIAGWTLWESALVYALVLVARGLHDLLCDGSWSLPWQIHSGALDRVLVRPLPPLLQVLASSSRLHGVGHLLLAGTILLTSTHQLALEWTLARVGLLVASVIGGLVILASVYLVANTLAFLTRSNDVSAATFAAQLGDMAQLPLDVYSPAIRFLFTFVVPFALIGYVPAAALLGRAIDPPWLVYAAPIAAVIAAAAAVAFFRFGLKRYESAGA